MKLAKQGVGSWCAIALAVLFVANCSGCGGNGRATVEGNVTYDGQPVETGSIVFEPADGIGPVGGGTIENGRYRLAGEGAVEPGEKIVRITAVRNTGRQVQGGLTSESGTMVDEVESYIPAIYNANSTLTCKVVAGEVNTLDFHLEPQ